MIIYKIRNLFKFFFVLDIDRKISESQKRKQENRADDLS